LRPTLRLKWSRSGGGEDGRELVGVGLATNPRIRLAMIRRPNSSHRLLQVVAHFDVLLKHMAPSSLVQLNQITLRVASLGDDIALHHPSNATPTSGHGARVGGDYAQTPTKPPTTFGLQQLSQTLANRPD
jgi:hypothetical protein